jgi:hypothetical protein
MSRYLLFVFVLCAACRLEPLVDDDPGASLEILPPGSELPRIDENLELLHQIQVHDGLDDGALEMNGGRVLRITGWAEGAQVSYWSFGNAPRFGALAYVLVDEQRRPIEHPMILDSIPGDAVYSPMRKLIHVVVTDDYDGEIFPTVESLTDGVELGLVLEPEPVGTWFDAPVVMPGTTLDRGESVEPTPTREAIAQGYRVDLFVFDDDPRAVQPLRSGSIPTTQAASLREQGSVSFKPSPVFQKALPAAPPAEMANYTPLVQIVEVQLATGVVAADLHADADLFTRGMTGSISGYTAAVDSATVTTVYKNWPMEFAPLEAE